MVSEDDVQRLFLQALVSRRVVTKPLARILLKKCVEAVKAAKEDLDIHIPDNDDSLNTFVINLNASLDKLDLEIVPFVDGLTGSQVYVLANRKGDEIAQVASDYSPAELAYFKLLVEMIITAPNSSYCLSSLAALRESQTLKATFTKTHAERILDTFVARGWLHKSKKGRFSLTTRSIVELQTYIANTFPNDVLHCTVCHEMVFRGIRCHTRNCEGILHSHCYAAYKRTRQMCPVCEASWGGDSEGKLKKIGEGAFVEGQDKHAKARRRADDDEDEDEDEDEVVYHEDEDAEAGGSTQPPQSQKKGKGKATGKGKASAKAKGKGKAREESMEVDTEEEEPAPKRRSSGRNKALKDEDGGGGEEEESSRPKRKSRR
ncbi:Nse1 non-SMC component of SMC5-6 complex-domain-containing protein [Thelephora terrestris]|uniref:Non-structural maintenance of chromosomes element 1 homolog n=1 Tax=Thelephora terrestris TaxID=56493 RepID=A0A9P6H6W2_9AGAM|nr:Nse1 non-SMC component of SMC5-6 complex-domain-containing protein [Thelephora terrestris]